jgi:putative ABC transport system permease protein
MKARVLVRVAGKSILKNKMRTFLTMLGIIIGVGSVIMMVAIGGGAKSRIEDRIQNLGTNMIVITPGASTTAGVSQGQQSFNSLTLQDAEMLRQQSFLLSQVSPVVMTRTQAIGGDGNWRTFILGVNTDYPLIRDWSTEYGVFFEEADVRSLRKVAVLGKTVAEALFPGQDPVGRQIQLRNVPFRIVGVLARKGQTAEGNDQDDVILAPYTTVQNRLSGWSRIGQILASTFSPEDIPNAQEEIRAILRDSHQLGSNLPEDFTIRNQQDLAEAAQETTEVMTLLLSAIACISLLVGGIGIMNIMLVSVTERTREIGLRLALGARGSDVMKQFLVESVVMSVAGGLIGVLVGFGGSTLLSAITGWSVKLSPPVVVLALLFAAVVGVFFGFYPARRAAALDPIEALRYE